MIRYGCNTIRDAVSGTLLFRVCLVPIAHAFASSKESHTHATDPKARAKLQGILNHQLRHACLHFNIVPHTPRGGSVKEPAALLQPPPWVFKRMRRPLPAASFPPLERHVGGDQLGVFVNDGSSALADLRYGFWRPSPSS
jgi:hypothetical protein